MKNKIKGQELGAQLVNPILYENDMHVEGGLTKREYFAGIALQGMIAHFGTNYTTSGVCRRVKEIADALLETLAE